MPTVVAYKMDHPREVGISEDLFGDEFGRAHDWRIRLLNKDPPRWKTLRQVVNGERFHCKRNRTKQANSYSGFSLRLMPFFFFPKTYAILLAVLHNNMKAIVQK
jgi:hypothetical protein